MKYYIGDIVRYSNSKYTKDFNFIKTLDNAFYLLYEYKMCIYCYDHYNYTGNHKLGD